MSPDAKGLRQRHLQFHRGVPVYRTCVKYRQTGPIVSALFPISGDFLLGFATRCRGRLIFFCEPWNFFLDWQDRLCYFTVRLIGMRIGGAISSAPVCSVMIQIVWMLTV